jgi:phosphoribosylanthranilate isomerase
MTPGFIKLCSLRQPDHATWAVEAGSDAFGLIFTPARRQVSPSAGAQIAAVARAGTARKPQAVGVFVNSDADEINGVAAQVGLDVAQLQGDESPDVLARVSIATIKAIRIEPEATFEQIASSIERYERGKRPPIAYHIESHHVGQAGGNGVLADWDMATQLARHFPIVLAGGLTPDNVGQAIEQVRPVGVDVSSGVESNGVKDRQKMIDFVTNARAAFERVK